MNKRLALVTGISFLILLSNSRNVLGQSRFQSAADLPAFNVSQLDTSRLLSDRPLKSPGGAVLRSAILPGWGQVYTHQYWKAGVAFSLNSFLVYNIFRYQQRWKDTANPDFQGKRNLYTWYFALSYLVTMADAYVDAYLFKFNEAVKLAQNTSFEDGKWRTELRLSVQF